MTIRSTILDTLPLCEFWHFGSCVFGTALFCCASAAGMKGWADGLNICLNGEGCLGCLLGWTHGLTIGCINCALGQHVSLGLGAVTAVTVAGVQQVIAEMPVGLLQEATLVQHFAVVCYVNCLNVWMYLLMLVMFAVLVTFVHMVWSCLEMNLSPVSCLPYSAVC